MSWLKKLFSSQSSFQSSLQSTSEEPKVYYSTQISTKTEEPKKETTEVTESKFEQCDETTQSTRDFCYSWSGISQSVDIKSEKRGWSDRLNHNQPKNQPKKYHFIYHNQAVHNKRRLAILNKKMMTTNRRTNQKK